MDVPAITRSKRESVIFLLVTCSPFVLVEKKVPRGRIQSKYCSISLLPAASNLSKEMSIKNFVKKSLFQSIAGAVHITGLILLTSTREMSRDTQAALSLPSYNLQGMSINSLWYGTVYVLYCKGKSRGTHNNLYPACILTGCK